MANKLDKRTNCEYCDKPLDAKYRSKKFCDDKCRIYWNREQKVEKIITESFENNREEIDKTVNDILEGGIAITKSDTDGNMERIDPRSEEGQKVIDTMERIKVLEHEISHPPKTAVIGVKTWIKVRENELAKLKTTI